MKLSSPYFTVRPFVATLLLMLYLVPLAASTSTRVPDSVARGDAAISFLWDQVQGGALVKWLPEQFAHVQRDWWDFLHNEAVPVINTYY